jgi:transposase-like protein
VSIASVGGGKAKNMHKHVRERKINGRGPSGKAIVLGLVERGGRAHTTVIPNREGETLKPIIREQVAEKTGVFTDAHGGYNGLDAEYLHGVIDHAVAYVEGKIHTNNAENFWTLLKRTINGTYVQY